MAQLGGCPPWVARGPWAPYYGHMRGRERPHPPPILSLLKLMRKIEQQMVNAIKNSVDFKLANTQVVSCTNVSDVYLHGNLIARIGETWMELFDGGWQSNTTKSRLNALLQAFGMEGEYVFQKNFQWFLNYNGFTIPFFSGMRLN
jgi:hypothetical protein